MRTRKSHVLYARALRKNQTKAEQFLWTELRNRNFLGYKFRRQHPIGNSYIVDFYCAKKRLIIEIDGAIHDELCVKENDEDREEFLKNLGYKVIRIRNDEVFDQLEKVVEKIEKALF